MSKRCARCEKAVYPIEELKCLDKVWHKGCFKCQECAMTLSMKTYKGFNKFPYCEAHIPKAKATTMAETPEMKRLAENTKIQSNVQYHADFEKNKAKFTQVADDPETRRIKQNTKIISNVSYHGDLEKKAIMELKRADPVGKEEESAASQEQHGEQPQVIQQPYHHPQQHHPAVHPSAPISHSAPPSKSVGDSGPSPPYGGTPGGGAPNVGHVPHTQQPQQRHYYHQQPQGPQNQSYMQQYPQQTSTHPYYQSSQNSHPSSTPYSSHSHHHPQSQPQNHQLMQQQQQQHQYHKIPHSQIAQVAQNVFQDANHNSPYSARTSQTLIYSSQTGPVQQPTQSRRVGSIADYDPLNEHHGSLGQNRPHHPHHGAYRQDAYMQSHKAGTGSGAQQQQKITAPPTQLGRCYRALYDYEAADTDEISFKDGDLIINCTSIDEGWMTGTVQRSNRTGMLPANYVERVS